MTSAKPLLVLRENTERPEEVASMLEDARRPDSWVQGVAEIVNPFGQGDSGRRIADAIGGFLEAPAAIAPAAARDAP